MLDRAQIWPVATKVLFGRASPELVETGINLSETAVSLAIGRRASPYPRTCLPGPNGALPIKQCSATARGPPKFQEGIRQRRAPPKKSNPPTILTPGALQTPARGSFRRLEGQGAAAGQQLCEERHIAEQSQLRQLRQQRWVLMAAASRLGDFLRRDNGVKPPVSMKCVASVQTPAYLLL